MASRILTALLALLLSVTTMAVKDLDFHYLVLMWPGSYCKQTSAGCCFPKTGKPELDFFVLAVLGLKKLDQLAFQSLKKTQEI